MSVTRVKLAGRSYEVRAGSGLLADLAVQCGPLLRKKAESLGQQPPTAH